MRPHLPAYQIFGQSAQKPNLNQLATKFEGQAHEQNSIEETGPTASIFMPSTSFEKPSTVQHYSLYETVGGTSVADPNRDPLVI